MNTSRSSLAWGVYRVAVAALLAAAVIAQAVSTFSDAIANDRDVATTVGNFFSYFTVLSNVSAALVFAWAGGWLLLRRRGDNPAPLPLAIALASVSSYMIVTGVVYNLLLRGYQLQAATIPWSNEVLHLVGPLLVVVDVLFAVGVRALSWRSILAVLAFPIVWVVYTFLRAPLVTAPLTGDPWWYPYPFLNPHIAQGGWGEVVLYVVGIAVFIAAVASLVVAATRWRGAQLRPSALRDAARSTSPA